jgi:hypothetical protein
MLYIQIQSAAQVEKSAALILEAESNLLTVRFSCVALLSMRAN